MMMRGSWEKVPPENCLGIQVPASTCKCLHWLPAATGGVALHLSLPQLLVPHHCSPVLGANLWPNFSNLTSSLNSSCQYC